MFLLGFFLGLAVAFSFWVWQQFQLSRCLQQVHQPLTSHFHGHEVPLPLVPSLRQAITGIQRQQQLMQESLQTYVDLLDFAPLGYLQVDEENQLLWCNQQAQEILHLQRWQPGQVRLLLELVRSYELDQLIEQTRDWQKPQIREWVFHPSYDRVATILEPKSLALRCSSLPLPQGQVGVFLENRQPLIEINQERDRSFSDLAHELRTPLTSIRLVVETLQGRLDPTRNRWVNRLMQEVDRLIHLVQSWLELTQMEANPSMQLKIEAVEMRSLIASVWETLEPLAKRQHLSLNYSGQETVWIKADRFRIYQVFLNLLDNCIKYSPPCTSIDIEAKIITPPNSHQVHFDYQHLEINIIDSGVGFAEIDLPHVFERFYRGDKARTRDSLREDNSTTPIIGSGLGLAIVRQIVIAHGGLIKAMNHPETGGAWMQIELPEVVAKEPMQDYT